MPCSALEGKQITLLSRLLLRTSCSQPYWLGHSQKNQTKLLAVNFITLTCPAGTFPTPTPILLPIQMPQNLFQEQVKIPATFRPTNNANLFFPFLSLRKEILVAGRSGCWKIQLQRQRPRGETGSGMISLWDWSVYMKYMPLSKCLIAFQGTETLGPYAWHWHLSPLLSGHKGVGLLHKGIRVLPVNLLP